MNYQTKTNLILPFKGTLVVSNGGRTPETNSHNRPADKGPQNQIYAYDFRMDNSGNEKELKDYGVYGIGVIAPGDGIITQVVNGSFDCEAGESDRSVGVGNMVVIDHQNGEYSVISHFMYQSIVVKLGDQVKQGDLLGLCGNTGNTSQPHIHFNLQDDVRGYRAKALPAQFRKILVNEQLKENYEPVRFQWVANL